MIIVALIFLGLCLGSFVNALVWRLHQQQLPKKKRAASNKELSIATGRSMCPHCKHVLAWYDLLPVISWLSVSGKCRYCSKPIGWQYPIVELLTAVLFVWSYTAWDAFLNVGDQLHIGLFALWLVSLVMLVALTVYDLRWMLLPNRIVFPLLGVAVVQVLLRSLDNGADEILSSFGALLVAGGIFYILFQVSSGKWIGGGDVKLGFALGLLLGDPVLAFMMLFTASVLGLIVALPGVILRRTALSSKIPFGPYLILATIIVKLYGTGAWDWYQAYFLGM